MTHTLKFGGINGIMRATDYISILEDSHFPSLKIFGCKQRVCYTVTEFSTWLGLAHPCQGCPKITTHYFGSYNNSI